MTITVWEDAKTILKGQMTTATYDTLILGAEVINNGGSAYTIGAPSARAAELLEARLKGQVQFALQQAAGKPVSVEFTVLDAPAPAYEEPPPENGPAPEPPVASVGQRVCTSDIYALFFERGGSGYSMLSHYSAIFWNAYLGDAFHLWKRLDVDDKRHLRDSGWTPPARHRFTRLAHMLNRTHPRVISGGVIECWHSSKMRHAGEPLTCCENQNYKPVKIRTDGDGCDRCWHWHVGLLERLNTEGIAIVNEKNADSPRAHLLQIQIWRLLPLLTPHQVRTMHAHLQWEHARWLQDYGHIIGLDTREWEQITEPSLLPLMPGYDDHELVNNFDPSRKFREL